MSEPVDDGEEFFTSLWETIRLVIEALADEESPIWAETLETLRPQVMLPDQDMSGETVETLATVLAPVVAQFAGEYASQIPAEEHGELLSRFALAVALVFGGSPTPMIHITPAAMSALLVETRRTND